MLSFDENQKKNAWIQFLSLKNVLLQLIIQNDTLHFIFILILLYFSLLLEAIGDMVYVK